MRLLDGGGDGFGDEDSEKTMNDYFGLLYARPSFVEGLGRVLDIGATLTEYNTSLTGAQADLLALRADLQALRSDFAEARKKAADTPPPKTSLSVTHDE